MNKSFLFTVATGFAVILVSAAIIFFAKGYTFNPQNGQVQKTGIMVITSEPTDAAVYINGQLKDTTNTTLNFLTPGTYKVEVTKDGFTPWTKMVVVRPELVTRLDLTLFPQVPDLRRLTFTGASSVQVTPDGQRILYRVNTADDKAGLWTMIVTDQLPFLNTDPVQIYQDTGKMDLSKVGMLISPDSKSLLLVDNDTPSQPVYYQLDMEQVNANLTPMSPTDVQTLLSSWQETLFSKETNLRQKLVSSVSDVPSYETPKPDITEALTAVDTVLQQTAVDDELASSTPSASPTATPVPTKLKDGLVPTPSPIASPAQDLVTKIQTLSTAIQWSQMQDKLLFMTPDGKTHIYDMTTGQYYDLVKADAYYWYPSDLHIIMVNPQGKKGQIVVSDLDGQNPVVVYSGQFTDKIAIPAFSGTKIIILTNLNQTEDTEPNLYAINLR